MIDFTHPKLLYRLKEGGGKSQMIAKACGLAQLKSSTIIDACAGFGTDGIILAALGAHVIMIERNPTIAEDLRHAFEHAKDHPDLSDILTRITFIAGDAKDEIPKHPADVIYLDPMFPSSSKTALHQKNLQRLKQTVGTDADAGELLTLALRHATYRTVVKRPRKSETLIADPRPHFSLNGKANRFDIYVNKGLPR
jgi:16S rRNA (guanine1516-N2)-methyltransferase